MRVHSSGLKRDYMGLVGKFGVHLPTSMLPEGYYEINSVLNRWWNVTYRCGCGYDSYFRGQENICPWCGHERPTRMTRGLRKLMLWFAVRFLRRFFSFDYYCDPDFASRCPECGTYLQYDDYCLYCWRCYYSEYELDINPKLRQAIEASLVKDGGADW